MTSGDNMKRSRSSIAWVFGSGIVSLIVLGGCSVTTAPGSLTLKSKTAYHGSPDPTVTAAAAWAGQVIKITNDGVNPAVNGGVMVVGDASVTTISATAHVTAYADADDEASANQSIQDAIATFTITQDDSTTTITCNHGNSHGSSDAAQSGCELLTIHVPLGSIAQPIGLVLGSGNGDVSVTGPLVGSAQINTKGSGDTNVALTPTVGANITVNGGDAVTLALPSDFAANSITLMSADTPPAIDTSAFPDVVSGQGRGASGTGASAITVTSSGILDSDVVKLVSQ
ncbi:MAG: hypothetical protein ABI461_23290 [Polyangiaceae bacterium]